jgi:hypothetical protein
VELYSIVNKVKGRDEANLVDETEDVSTSETAICLVTGTVLRSGSTRRAFSTRAVSYVVKAAKLVDAIIERDNAADNFVTRHTRPGLLVHAPYTPGKQDPALVCSS